MGRAKTEEEKLIVCEICGSMSGVFFNGKINKHLYSTHRAQIYRKGNLYKSHKDRNEIFIYGDYAEVVMYDKNCQEQARAIIDKTDIELLKPYKWFLHSQGYAAAHHYKTRRRFFMHRLIMGEPKDLFIDHIDHNPLNNRKQNLRIVTEAQNAYNKKTTNPVGVSGVYLPEKHVSWKVQIGYGNKTVFLGSYKNLEDAIQARIDGEFKYYGFSPTLEQRGSCL